MTYTKITVNLDKDINELMEFVDSFGSYSMEIEFEDFQKIGVNLFLDVYEYEKVLKSLKRIGYDFDEE